VTSTRERELASKLDSLASGRRRRRWRRRLRFGEKGGRARLYSAFRTCACSYTRLYSGLSRRLAPELGWRLAAVLGQSSKVVKVVDNTRRGTEGPVLAALASPRCLRWIFWSGVVVVQRRMDRPGYCR
jgi:hypothetical protein